MPSPDDLSTLPIIDLQLARDPKTRPALAKKLFETLKTVGFMYVEGINGYDSAETEYWTKWFFNLPQEVKNTIARKSYVHQNDNIIRGYFPVLPGNISHKEGLEYGPNNITDPDRDGIIFLEDNPWLDLKDEANAKFKEFVCRYYDIFQKTCVEMMRLVAEGVGVESNFFDYMFKENPISTFRLMHYPARDPKEIPDNAKLEDGTILSTGEHADSPIMTLLDTFKYKGLQYRRDDGLWVDIPHREGALVGNIGEMLSRWSGGVLKATIHRVLDIGESRYSLPFFLEPSWNTDISKQLPITDKPAWPQPLTYATYYLNKMLVYAEYEDLPQYFPPKTAELAKKAKVALMYPELKTK